LPVGSSASKQEGSLTSARAMAARWRSPPDKLARAMFETVAETDRGSISAAFFMPRSALGAANQQRHGDVFQRRKLGQQVMKLIDEAEMLVAPIAAVNLAESRKITPHQLHDLPAVGASRPPSRCSSVLLPEPEAPTMATVSPGNAQIDPDSTFTSSPPPRKILLSTSSPERFTHSAAPPPD
jgi:hypothetical protein